MGTFSVPIAIGDPQGQRWLDFDALVDTGASITSLPASALRSLGVRPIMRQAFRFGQGEVRRMSIGETKLQVEGRVITTQALFNEEGTPPLLGALALEGAFLGVDPVAKRLVLVDGLMMQSPRAI